MLRKPLQNRSSRPEVFCEKSALKNFEKTPAPESLFWQSSRLRTATLLKRGSNRRFPVKHAKFILRNNLFYGGIKVLEYLQKTKTLKMSFFLGQSFATGLK